MRALLATVGVSLLLVGCSSHPDSKPQALAATPIPTVVGGTVPVPTNTLGTTNPTDAAVPPDKPEEATAPPPANAGPLSARNLPAPGKLGAGWATYADPGGAEAGFIGNKTWTRRRDANQAAFEALPSGCAGQPVTGSLPVPQYALAGTYRTADKLPATALLFRFSDAAKATAYFSGYQNRMKACGSGGDLSVKPLWSEQTAAAAIRAYAEAESYVDVSVVHGSTLALLATTSARPDTQAEWAHTVVLALETVMDQP